MNFKNSLFQQLYGRTSFRRLILLTFDLLILYFSFISTFWITGDYESINENILILKVLIINGVFLYLFTGQYRGITRYSGSTSIYFIVLRIFLLIFLINTYSFFTNIPTLDASKLIILFIFISYATSFLRIFLRDLIAKKEEKF